MVCILRDFAVAMLYNIKQIHHSLGSGFLVVISPMDLPKILIHYLKINMKSCY